MASSTDDRDQTHKTPFMTSGGDDWIAVIVLNGSSQDPHDAVLIKLDDKGYLAYGLS